MPKFIDETGNTYGRITVLRRATADETNGRRGGVYWLCRCSCGTETVVCGHSLRIGETKSCGCYSKDRLHLSGKKLCKSYRVGEICVNYQSCKMQIVEYNSSNDIYVKFDTPVESVVHTSYKEFMSGSVRNPYYPEVYGVGCTGNKYHSIYTTKAYKVWHGILQRCFDAKLQVRQPTYADCTIDDIWLVFENFYDWVMSQSNYDNWLHENRWMVDKDILVKHNKKYGPDTCCLVPEYINVLFTKRQNDRGVCPIGVYYDKRSHRYKAQCSNPLSGKREGIGVFDNPTDAFLAYKSYKENLVKEIASIEYDRGNISYACYCAMMSYTVDISD